MADYTIQVGVEVEDSKLDALETRINSLKDKHVKLNVDFGNSKQLARNAQTAVKTINKATVKAAKNSPSIKGANLVEQMVDPEKALKAMSSTVDKLSKYQGKLDLGEVRLSVNQGIMGELDGLLSKLNEIKATAKNMGSIKLTVGDNIKTQDGKIVVGSNSSASTGSVRSSGLTLRQAQAEIKKNMKTIGTLQEQYINGHVDESTYRQSKKTIGQRNAYLARMVQTQGTASDWVTSATDFREAQAKNRAAYREMTSSADAYDKVISDLGEKQKTFNEAAQVYNSNSRSPLNKTLGPGYQARLTAFNDVYGQLKESHDKISTLTGDEKDLEKVRFSALKSEANRQARQLNNVSQFFSKTPNKYSRSEFVGTDLDVTSDKVQNKMSQMVDNLANGSRYTKEFNAAQGKMYATIDRGSGVFEKYQLAYKNGPGNIDQSLSKVTQSVKPLSSYISEMGQKFRSLSQYLISNFGFQALTTGIRSGVTSIKELDSAMTELKKTSEGTKQEYRDFTTQARSDAKDIGSTTTQITNSAADFSRLGYTLGESQTLAKNTGILKNVSEFESIDDATTAMISMMKAYDVKVDDSMDLIDKMNLIGNNYAISTDGIATALQDSGSALVAAGNDFDKSVALVTAANSVVQDPSKVGAGLRTIALRLRGTTAEELSSMGEDTEGLVETTSKLNSNIKSLTAVNGKAGVSILDMNGNYRDTYDILKDISQVWDDIGKQDLADGQNRQAALLEMMAGKNRSNILASILQHPELLTDVYNDSANNYQNSAQNELNTYLDSIEAKTTKIKESWSQLWQSEGSTNTFKGLLDIGNGAVGLLNGLGLNKTLAGVGGMLVSHAMNWGGTNYQLVL
jgi:TP901 family phage tail tape measure protein|nr:MAG TPA: minor tail protein [Caudoviricetes sp.]